jgi:wyosine [tRNA(Phe)-imidazoG37] synthetase (radical SAM superfamily)
VKRKSAKPDVQKSSGGVGRYVFGPVPSRRLGRSLGVDIVPFKTCTFDCIYCQLGRTTNKTIVRDDYAPVEEVLGELDARLKAGVSAEHVTISGSGEPTLHRGIGDLIDGIKRLTRIPVAVLTNGSLLYDPEVRRSLLEADVVVPSLDAGDEATFEYVNRPHPDIGLERMIEGMIAFRKEFRNSLWLEVMLVAGVTGVRGEIEKIAAYAEKMNPDKIQLNTVARPPAEKFARAVPPERMESLAKMFRGNVEVIADVRRSSGALSPASREEVLGMILRRPCSAEDVSAGLDIALYEAEGRLAELGGEGLVRTEEIGGRIFYVAEREASGKAPKSAGTASRARGARRQKGRN